MKKGVKVWGLIAVLIVIGSLFMGIVSTEVIVADVNKDIAATNVNVTPTSPKGDLELVRGDDETDTSTKNKTERIKVTPTSTHDMVVTNVNTTPSSPDLEQPTVIYVTVTNEGEQQEDNVSVKVYVDSAQIGSTQYISLAPGSSNTTTFLWTPTTAKAYSVKGEVEIVNGEIDVKDNTKSIKVRVSAVPTPTPTPTPTPHSALKNEPCAATFTIYATREGLVGQTTANGHVIQSHDHFVALPSTKALCSNGGHEFEVRVTYNGKSIVAPIWDVGPWNTKDDYWNPSSQREMWNDLPQGKPEAQAAYYDGYNSGKDQYGRTVTNPAGIDLADGTFWDDLGMTDNDWVTVEFLWLSNGGATYDPLAAVNYADTWWNGRNSNYHDYSSSGGDCANFVSQCLIAGGLDLSVCGSCTWIDDKGCLPRCRDLHTYLVDYLHATWETRSRGQVEPLWFVPGDPAIFGYSDSHPLAHAVFAVTGDASHYATCNAHTSDQYHRTFQWFFDNDIFDRCTYYHIPNTAESIITPLSGDLNDDDTDSYGSFDSSTAGFTFNGKTVHFGTSTDLPVMGDWDNDGSDEIGIYRPDNGGGQSEFHLVWQDWGFFSDGASVDAAYRKIIPFGYYPNNIPIAGDWDGINNDDLVSCQLSSVG